MTETPDETPIKNPYGDPEPESFVETAYAIHALLGHNPDGTSSEVSREFPTLDEMFQGIAELVQKVPTFSAITIVHATDLPMILGASAEMPAAETGPYIRIIPSCYHCGKMPDADGDHDCSCPNPDGSCPAHDPDDASPELGGEG